MITLKIVCIEEPDLSYTRNKNLIVGETYLGVFDNTQLGGFGFVPLYTVYDMNENKMGQYYAKDFRTISEYRDLKLKEILG